MRSILETFAYGNMSPNAQPRKDNARYGDAMRMRSRNEEKLLELLNGEGKVIFEKYIDANDEVNQLTAVHNWLDGYGLGLVLTAEFFAATGD